MKRIGLYFLCIALMTVALASCTAVPVTPQAEAPEHVITRIAPDAAIEQFGQSTWQTTLKGTAATNVQQAFVDAGYQRLDASVVDGAIISPWVLVANDVQITLYPSEEGVRVMWDVTAKAAQDLLVPNEATGTSEVTMVQIGVARNQTTDNPAIGMCYVYRLSDGRAVILDGGIPGNETVIYQALQTLDVAKDADGKYQIAAWILSHGHGDHFGAMLNFASIYAETTSVEYFMYSLPVDKTVLTGVDVPFFVSHLTTCFPDAVHVTPHAGLRYYIGNLTLDMLYTPDMLERINYENNTSLIFIADCAGARVLHLGDAGDQAAATALSCFAESAFVADAFQMTHHGLFTGPNDSHGWEYLRSMYDATGAKTVLLPMGTRSPSDSRNGRHTVLIAWGNLGYQTSYVIDKRRTSTNHARTAQEEYDNFVEQIANGTCEYQTFCGYDGKNIIYNKQKDLTTYIMSTETEEMATVLVLSSGNARVTQNELLSAWLN